MHCSAGISRASNLPTERKVEDGDKRSLRWWGYTLERSHCLVTFHVSPLSRSKSHASLSTVFAFTEQTSINQLSLSGEAALSPSSTSRDTCFDPSTRITTPRHKMLSSRELQQQQWWHANRSLRVIPPIAQQSLRTRLCSPSSRSFPRNCATGSGASLPIMSPAP
jgi:hypothetical protein